MPGGRLTWISRHNGNINDGSTADGIARIITTLRHARARGASSAKKKRRSSRTRNARFVRAQNKMAYVSRTHTSIYTYTHTKHTHTYTHTHAFERQSTVQSVPRANREQRRRVSQRRHIGLQNKARSEKHGASGVRKKKKKNFKPEIERVRERKKERERETVSARETTRERARKNETGRTHVQ